LFGSRKYPYPHHRGSLAIPRMREVIKDQIFKGKYEPNWNFQRSGEWGGCKPKKLSMGGVWIFSGTTHSTTKIVLVYWLSA